MAAKNANESMRNQIHLLNKLHISKPRPLVTLKAGLHVRRKHKHEHKHKPRMNRDDASPSARPFFLRVCLRRPGSHVAYVLVLASYV